MQNASQTTPKASQRFSQLQFPMPTFVTEPPTSPPSSADGTVRGPRGHDNSRVLDRITALLHKEELPNAGQAPTANSPMAEPKAESFEIELDDRPAIKVLVVTWNMGDALVSRGM